MNVKDKLASIPWERLAEGLHTGAGSTVGVHSAKCTYSGLHTGRDRHTEVWISRGAYSMLTAPGTSTPGYHRALVTL